MKKATLSIIFGLLFISSFAQIDSLIYLKVYSGNMAYEKPDDNSNFINTVSTREIPIIGFAKGGPFEFLKIYYLGKERYIFKSATNFEKYQIDLIKKLLLSERNLRIAKSVDSVFLQEIELEQKRKRELDEYYRKKAIEDSIAKAEEEKKQQELEEKERIESEKRAKTYLKRATPFGIGLIDYNMIDDELACGFDATIQNLSLKKKIKYVTFVVTFYNPVDDPIQTYTRKLVGPILPGETASVEFKYVCYSKVCHYVKIIKIQVEYFDGTKSIVNKDQIKTIRL